MKVNWKEYFLLVSANYVMMALVAGIYLLISYVLMDDPGVPLSERTMKGFLVVVNVLAIVMPFFVTTRIKGGSSDEEEGDALL